MTRDVVTVTAGAPLKEVAALFIERDISGVPVVDETGKVLGVVSESDILHKERERESGRGGLLRHLFRRDNRELETKRAARTAAEAMTSPAVAVWPSTSVSVAATLMLERGVRRLVVVEGFQFGDEFEEGRLVGIVTRGDFVRAFARSDQEILPDLEEIIHYQYWIPTGHVSVSIDNGDVTLTGEVDHRRDADGLALAIARVPGIVSVDSRLGWRYEEEPTLPTSRELRL